MKSWTVLLAVCSGFISTTLCAAKETIHVCEGDEKIITCDRGIEVVSARYGRFDRVTCLHTAMSKVGCFDEVLAKILSKCEGKATCALSPSNTEYGDPCPGTFKYLKVQFNCPSSAQVEYTMLEAQLNYKTEYRFNPTLHPDLYTLNPYTPQPYKPHPYITNPLTPYPCM
ncbi:L-rhamnose-binding lectin CSL3 [Mizuhopecten yessoensis]|uniref:L-rhamnose-binding lectin CSL3 n=1 Tax=Mizuhopecten yessoensis TaxID=6573 RepID=A0A210QXQ7_MIZYE|nr:L-rhamnose-binding lectin CSL3 [Mizuhopecten yessoensis]